MVNVAAFAVCLSVSFFCLKLNLAITYPLQKVVRVIKYKDTVTKILKGFDRLSQTTEIKYNSGPFWKGVFKSSTSSLKLRRSNHLATLLSWVHIFTRWLYAKGY